VFYNPVVHQLLKAVHRQNPGLSPPLTEGDVLVTPPNVINTPTSNTRVTLKVRAGCSAYSGQVNLEYTRWSLDRLLYGLFVPGHPERYTSSREALRAMIEYYHLPMAVNDVVLTPVGPTDQRLTLTAVPNALGVYGEAQGLQYADRW